MMEESRFLRSIRRCTLLLLPAALLAVPALALGGGSGAAVVDPDPDPDPDAVVTFASDIALILQENCQVCHQLGGIGPMSLTTYEEVRPWAVPIRHLVATREMPPYHYDTDVGIQQIKNDWRMSEADIKKVLAWVDAGAPMGDEADMPPPMESPEWDRYAMEEYFGRPPDVVVTSTPFDVPAVGSDLWWRPLVPSGITESRCSPIRRSRR